jgi:hypothetical protein
VTWTGATNADKVALIAIVKLVASAAVASQIAHGYGPN